MNDLAIHTPTCGKCHRELTDTKPHTATGRRKYCDVLCRTTAWKRKKAGKPIADPRPELDQLVAERNQLLAQLAKLAPSLEKTSSTLHERENENRRHRYAAEIAESNADKKISFHGAAIVSARERAERAEARTDGYRSESARLRDENAVLRDQLRTTLATLETLKTRRTSGPKVQRTLATQVYFAFHQLAKDYREIRRGVDLDDSDYRLFDQAARNQARLKLNGTDIDQRTLYYFARLTKAAYQRGRQQNHQDANTANNVKLYNVVSKLVAIPKGIRPLGEITHIPEPALPNQQEQP